MTDEWVAKFEQIIGITVWPSGKVELFEPSEESPKNGVSSCHLAG
jgi:hypothetical protein